MTIQEINQVSVTILMDNTTDLLLTNSNHVNRPPLTKNEKFILPLPVAEHGFFDRVYKNFYIYYCRST